MKKMLELWQNFGLAVFIIGVIFGVIGGTVVTVCMLIETFWVG